MAVKGDSCSTFDDLTYAEYGDAAQRTHPESKSFTRPFSILPFNSIVKLLIALHVVLIHCFWPYILVSLVVVSIYEYVQSQFLVETQSILLFIALYIAYTVYSSFSPLHTKPGLYFSLTQRNLRIVSGSALLSKERNHPGAVSNDYGFTPWIITGDLCTMFPFLFNSPPHIDYTRRWVRVPLSEGPIREQPTPGEAKEEFEAVAVDFILSEQCTSSNGGTSKNLLILAGLSGGSEEGYCRDLVLYARRLGWNCFVMVGRGLSDPNLSNATFHTARTSDAAAVAKAIKESFGGKVMAVGISLGGIIVCHGLCRGDLSEHVDGGVSICGCYEYAKNSLFKHARRVWQPLLAHGIKAVFADDSMMAGKLVNVLGKNAEKILQDVIDVPDFDAKIVAPMNNYESVYQYYDDVSATFDRLKSCKKPLLEIHAVDDPIASADCVPSTQLTNGLTHNMFAMFTRNGGHVGWPLGWAPWTRRWEFQNTLAMEFLTSVAAVAPEHDEKET